jgi:hypothetical protein
MFYHAPLLPVNLRFTNDIPRPAHEEARSNVGSGVVAGGGTVAQTENVGLDNILLGMGTASAY